MTVAPILADAPSARVLNVSAVEYHADPLPVPSLSVSIASILNNESAHHAWRAHPKLGGVKRKATKNMNEGSLMHALLLGKGAEIVEIEADDYKRKAAQQARDAATEQGALPVLSKDLDAARTSAEKIRAKLASKGIVFSGDSELVVAWEEYARNGTPVQCRGMMDHVIRERAHIYDLKIVASAHPRDVARHAYDYGYDIQHAAYLSAISKLLPGTRPTFDFVFIEAAEPYYINVTGPDGAGEEIGLVKWQRAVNMWAECMRTGVWPEYTTGRSRWETPGYIVQQEMMGDW